MAQFRALSQGGHFAYSQGAFDKAGQYWEQAGNVLCFLQSYWHPDTEGDDGYIKANMFVVGDTRKQLDINPSIAAIHLFDPSVGCDDTTFQPCAPKSLASLKRFVDSFRNGSVTPMNAGVPAGQAVAVGRYAEDV